MSKRHINVLLVGLLCLATALVALPQTQAQPAPQESTTLHLPIIARNYPWRPITGFETSTGVLPKEPVRGRAQELGAGWVRLNTLSWRAVQPTPGAPLNQAALAVFEQEVLAAAALQLTPIVVVDDSPEWATINQPSPTSCGAIRADRFADFAAFMAQLVERYRQAPYNVHHWEIGNEVDVDPRLVGKDSQFGCWGNSADPYYGGEHYGNMLEVVTPAIKRADPSATVIVGGLLLATPNDKDQFGGTPSKFFEGILSAGAADSFDAVAFHMYPRYENRTLDYDLEANPWQDLGGWTLGKIRFLREVMARYGVDKPLMITETGLLCTSPPEGQCNPDAQFLQAQADFVVRMLTRAWVSGIRAATWYTLDAPGWRAAALLDNNQNPKPVYTAYQQFNTQTRFSDAPKSLADYTSPDANVEAYRFNKGAQLVDVVWSKDTSAYTVRVPQAQFVAAFNWDGTPITTMPSGDQVLVTVGFSPVYIHRSH